MEDWKRNLMVMWFAQWGGMVTITFINSFIPLYVADLGISDIRHAGIWAGVLTATSAFFAAVSSPFWGNLADKRGRKIMVQRVLFSNTFITVFMALATNTWQFLGLRAIQGTLGGFSAAAVALVTSFTPPKETSYALGVFQSAMIAGSAAGPLLGGFLVDSVGPKSTFMLMGLASLLPALAVRFLVWERFTPDPNPKDMPLLQAARQMLVIPGLLPLVVVNFLIFFSMLIIAPIIPLFIKSLESSPEHIAFISGQIIAAGGVSSAVSAIATGRIGDWIGKRTLLAVLLVGSAITFAIQFFAQTPLQFLALRSLNGLFTGGMAPITLALINGLVPNEKRATAFGLNSSFSLMGNVLGPLVGGVMAAIVGLRGVFPITGLILLLTAVWVIRKIRIPGYME